MKDQCDVLTQSWNREIAANGTLECDLKPRILAFFSCLITTTIFGYDFSTELIKLNVWQPDGTYKEVGMPLYKAVRSCWEDIIKMVYNPVRVFFLGTFDDWRLTKFERNSRENCRAIRNFLRKNLRLISAEKNEKLTLIKILNDDPLFNHSEDQMVDIIFDFFFAAQATNSATACTIIHYITQKKERAEKLRKEAEDELQLNGKRCNDVLTMENIGDL